MYDGNSTKFLLVLDTLVYNCNDDYMQIFHIFYKNKLFN